MKRKQTRNDIDITIYDYITMIFRDKKTGALLNIRRDEYVNDRLYFSEIMRVVSGICPGTERGPLRYTRRYDELQPDDNNS
jgi:hypothetical protein